jgi:hypothetical protein
MTNLNRTLTGINTVYELQLKSVSKQVGSIERINEQTHHMAEQIEELNGIYAPNDKSPDGEYEECCWAKHVKEQKQNGRNKKKAYFSTSEDD